MELPVPKKQPLKPTIQCINDWCGREFPYNEEDKHMMACPHGSCFCTHPGCEFADSQVPFILHLREAHLTVVDRFPYDEDFGLVHLKVPAPGSPKRQLIGYGTDGAVFALHIHPCGMDTAVSFVCVRPAACNLPRYRVTMWANGPPMPGPRKLTGEHLFDVVKAVLEPTSSPTPGTVSLGDVTSFLSVPPRYLCGNESSKQLTIYLRIDKE
jgi:hypothetical protein